MTGSLAAVRRVGVFGGAFDPPHQAHVALAQVALDQLNLDTLHVIPTGEAWHKARPLTPAAHRLAMTQLAFAGMARVVVDAREVQRQGPSYTVDTLSELKAQDPTAQLFLVMGEDQARALTTWHAWEQIVQLAIICVAARADSTGARGQFGTDIVHGVPVHWLQMPPDPVSATKIRQHVAAHQSASPLVFDSVARYIALHHLYLTDR